jgi:hypothetical protein
MTEHDIELARQAGAEIYELGKREAYLNQMRYTFDQQQLTKFTELIRAEKPQGEAVARVIKVSGSFFFDWLSMEAASKVRDGRHLLYTTPPDQSAEIARLRGALQSQRVLLNDFFTLLNAFAEKPHGEGVGGNDPNVLLAEAYAIVANLRIENNKALLKENT